MSRTGVSDWGDLEDGADHNLDAQRTDPDALFTEAGDAEELQESELVELAAENEQEGAVSYQNVDEQSDGRGGFMHVAWRASSDFDVEADGAAARGATLSEINRESFNQFLTNTFGMEPELLFAPRGVGWRELSAGAVAAAGPEGAKLGGDAAAAATSAASAPAPEDAAAAAAEPATKAGAEKAGGLPAAGAAFEPPPRVASEGGLLSSRAAFLRARAGYLQLLAKRVHVPRPAGDAPGKLDSPTSRSCDEPMLPIAGAPGQSLTRRRRTREGMTPTPPPAS